MHYNQIIELALALALGYLMQQNNGVWCEPSAGQTKWIPNEDSWHYWWSYSGISGPAYWGLLNLDWFICDKGRQQSPIDIKTKELMYDPHLSPLKVDSHLISGPMYNDGHAIVFNGSMSSFFLENFKTKSSSNEDIQSNGSKSKRSLVNNDDNGIFSKLSSTPLDVGLPPVDKKESTSVLMDLSNSVELSVKQNLDRSLDLLNDKNLKPNSVGGGGSNAENENELEQIDANSDRNQMEDPLSRIQFTGAGLAYPYRFEALYLRFGSVLEGSEHRIDGHAYAAELQLLAYNSLLYKSYAEASTKPHGLLGIAILIETMPTNETGSVQGPKSRVAHLNSVLESLLIKSSELQHRGSLVVMKGLNLSALLPDNDFFVAYEGSLTTPGCQESVDWLVLNKPLYISSTNLDILRSISADEQSNAPTGTLIADNIRPVQSTNQRIVRTNIRPSSSGSEYPETCQRLWTKYEFKQTREKTDTTTYKIS